MPNPTTHPLPSPEVPAALPPLLTPADREKILDGWSGPPHDPALMRDELLHELFERTAAQFASSTAIFTEQLAITYKGLDERSNQLAHFLRSHGSARGEYVALLLSRGVDVYPSLLAVLKSGAAYVPLDPDYPADRIAHILSDCNVKAVITHSSLAEKLPALGYAIIPLDTADLSVQPATPLSRTQTHLTPDDTAYVIYTSGSTGKPKGVPITHRSVCNLIRAESKIFNIQPSDRIYQGFSIAFDASIEEIWLAFFAGASLFPATAEMLRSGPALSTTLTAANITVLSCVPTLLAILQNDIPTLRLLIFGGEVCPPDLVAKWHRPHRRIVNTYGPTEATVIATFTDCLPSRPVTIGHPAPNYRTYILSEQNEIFAPGLPGELCISGPGLSAGYLNRPELTREKFKPNPFCATPPYHRIYHTGDLAKHTPTGEIEFLGRIDSQVKLRGFRIELAEIETAIRECSATLNEKIHQVAVTLREDTPGLQQLIAYVVPCAMLSGAGAPLSMLTEPSLQPNHNFESLRAALRLRLPVYMLPAHFEILTELPTLPSGKIDRKNLPAPKNIPTATTTIIDPPQTPLEQKITSLLSTLTGIPAISRTDNFFLDLGAHSLMVARLASELRTDGGGDFSNISVHDIYNNPTTEKLAAVQQFRQAQKTSNPIPTSAPSVRHTPSAKAHALFSAGQFLTLYIIVAFYALQWLTPYLTYVWMIEREYTRTFSIAASLAALLALYPLMLLATIAVKWLLVGKLKPGNYPLYSFFHLRWWLMQRITDAVAVEYLEGTPLLNFYYRCMGAKIGKNVHFGSYNIGAFDLVTVGDNSCLDDATALMAYTIELGFLKLAPITIGSNCYIGPGSVLRPNSAMQNNSRLLHMSLLPTGATIPENETWFGSPAAKIENQKSKIENPNPPSLLRKLTISLAHALAVFILPIVYLTALFPGLILLNGIAIEYGDHWSLLAAPIVAITFVALLCLTIVIVKWLLLGRVKPGDYSIYSNFYLRKWFVDQLMGLSLDVMGQLYATLYLNPWYRALGAKMGRRAEISTACAASPDLLDIGAESFIADAVLLGVPTIENHTLSLRTTTIGKRAFVGNSAVLPAGAVIADNTLIGVLSTPPLSTPGSAQPDTTWLGSPAIFLPQRQHSTAFPEAATFNPTKKLITQRLLIEAIRINLPIMMFVILTSSLITTIIELRPYFPTWQLLLLFPVLYFIAGLGAALFTIAAKWLLIGRYKESEKPLWSTFVWRSELINALHEKLAGAYLTDMLLGTPLLCLFFRLLGMKIGKRVYLDSAEFTEFDLVTLGDDAVLNIESTIQTHLFEDRVMKMSTIHIGPRASVGACSVVLYDTTLGADTILEDLSLIMKGESLPANTRWQGSPSRPTTTS